MSTYGSPAIDTCATMRVSCQGDIDECQQANRCLRSPGKAPDDPEREKDYGWETV